MIIVKLKGGLGNQMFQYAAGRSLAIKYNVPLYLDHSFLELNDRSYNGFTARKYELDIFDIAANQLSTSAIDDIFDANPGIMFKVYNEKPVTYDRAFKKIKPHVYMNGYWQSYLYFDHLSGELRRDFSFKENVIFRQNQETINQLISSNSVAVHIRRGDYVGNPIMSLCTMDYYKYAMDKIVKLQKDAIFFVFCDDLKWATENLNYDKAPVCFVGGEHNPDWLDMYLMSICRHNIIANSTFSWWSAWLNNNPNQHVVAPSKWFHQERKGINLDDLCLPTWCRL